MSETNRTAEPGASPRAPSLRTRLLAIGFGVLLGVVASELLLRVLAPLPRSHYVTAPFTRVEFRFPESEFPGIHGPSQMVANSLGLRSDELVPEDDFRILAIGGSTTVDSYLDQPEIWTQRLQVALNEGQQRHRVWVGNAGQSGHRTREHLVMARILLDELPPMDVVILLVGANDLLRRLAEDEIYDPGALGREGAESRLVPEVFQYVPVDERTTGFFQRMQLVARIQQVRTLMARWRRGRLEGTIEDGAGERIRMWRENRRNAVVLRDTLPDLGPALDEYAANLVEIAKVVRAHGARLVLMSQPMMWRSDLPPDLQPLLWLGGVGEFMREGARAEYYTVAALADGMARYNERLLEVCRRERIECIDLASALPRDTSVFYDDAHFNEAGAQRVAGVVAGVLIPEISAH